MSHPDLLRRYTHHPELKNFAQAVAATPPGKFHIAGLQASQLAFIQAALASLTHRALLCIAQDREGALAQASDLELLLPNRKTLLFPASSKRPYQVETIDNANVIERTEVLGALNRHAPGELCIVTYPEALTEKVINRQSLLRYTLEVKRDEKLGMDFLLEMLEEYGFESTDFVYEPGQYAVRGGIIDLYAFNHDLPYRLEFDGDAVESIRSFEPATQLSVQRVPSVQILPNVKTSLLTEGRVSLLEYISPATVVFVQDVSLAAEEVAKTYEKVLQQYSRITAEGAGTTVRSEPATLYYSQEPFLQELGQFAVVETGGLSHYPTSQALSWPGSPQPSFHKELHLVADHLMSLQQQGIERFIACENDKQIRRLVEVMQQLAPELIFTPITSNLSAGFWDKTLGFALYTDHQLFERYQRFRGKAGFTRSQALTLKDLQDLHPGDFVTHITHGIGRFAGLEKIKVGDHEQEAVKIIYQDGDTIYVAISSLHKISKYAGKEGAVPKLSKLGSQEWARTKARVKKRVKELAFDLVELYAKRKAQPAFAYSADSYMQDELEASFLYEDTPDQEKATEDVKRDMMSPHPMDRLVCGDVGFGKTEVSVRAAFKAVLDGKQVALLVPTTVLAVQHYNTYSERMKPFPVRIEFINRFKTPAEQKEILKDLALGKIDILIGTHRLLSKDILFKDLGLLIIDEEHKFGVGAKEKLRLLKVNIDTLTLTATPIPRTLQFSLLGIRDLSIIATPPPNRVPVETIVTTFEAETIRDGVAFELRRKGQVFFVHNRIKDLEEIAGMIKGLVPDARIAITHGQQEGERIEEVMQKFIRNEFDVLVCTTLIESGLDIPNANTIFINQAQSYGLSDLHQMRGRVGRSNRKAFCYLMAPKLTTLPADARKRLQAIQEFSDLGSGLQIAMRDLDIRGAGDILGSEQSGFISEVGYDFYHKILDEAVGELKAEHFPELSAETKLLPGGTVVDDCQVDTDQQVLIPDTYIPNVAERLTFYKRISEALDDAQLKEISQEMLDRFGLIPAPTLALFDTIRLREIGKRLGMERIVMKTRGLRAYFLDNPKASFFQGDVFGSLLAQVSAHPKAFQLKQVNDHLVLLVREVSSIKDAYFQLKTLADAVTQVPA